MSTLSQQVMIMVASREKDEKGASLSIALVFSRLGRTKDMSVYVSVFMISVSPADRPMISSQA